ncbi:Crp/Fnr family transcriptional regulator [Methylobacter sp. S3L5C]|uniref:Crp/Fnr family transcriptional regulator n=1 Tax=Methylobacter sp. S3L5C TaxID=2839024 RepID=UPI001FAE045C|nr:Crp/Fnr family transcriptional regulator [Methylobacter sp. S3L5C]UOA09551.1 Crp/Fnr family transcriptional regulator [Methylobacter sp. S3L5C]
MYFRSNGSKGLCCTCPNRYFRFCKSLLNSSSTEFDPHAVKNLAVTAKQYLYHQGDLNNELFVLQEGWVMLTRLSEDGKRQVFRSVLPGELLGFQQHLHGPAIYSAIALLDSLLCKVPNSVEYYSTQPELALSLAVTEACDKMLTEMYLGFITHRNARERIAFMVLELYHRLMMRGLNKEYSIQFPLKQEDIGDTLGLTTVHVNRTLHAFRDEGVLLIHKHELTILDYDMLHSLAGSTFKILAPEGLENPVEASKISSQVFKYKSPEDH